MHRLLLNDVSSTSTLSNLSHNEHCSLKMSRFLQQRKSYATHEAAICCKQFNVISAVFFQVSFANKQAIKQNNFTARVPVPDVASTIKSPKFDQHIICFMNKRIGFW
jgi:hypothetical protein